MTILGDELATAALFGQRRKHCEARRAATMVLCVAGVKV
jgi:hypothetical protein